MKIPTLLGALALMAALAAPVAAQASDRHSPHSGRRHGYAHRYDGPRSYYRAYPPRHRAYYYDRYDYRPYYGGAYSHDPYYDDSYYDAPAPRAHFHYHGRVRCFRPHVSLFFRW